MWHSGHTEELNTHMGYDCYEIVVTVVHEATFDETWPALQVMLLAEPLLNSLGMEWVKTL